VYHESAWLAIREVIVIVAVVSSKRQVQYKPSLVMIPYLQAFQPRGLTVVDRDCGSEAAMGLQPEGKGKGEGMSNITGCIAVKIGVEAEVEVGLLPCGWGVEQLP
jgi:hypothetical protein